MQRRRRHVLRNIKFLLKKKKGSPFEKEESALRVSIDMVPERAASHMPASKPRDLPETLRVSASGSRHLQPGGAIPEIYNRRTNESAKPAYMVRRV